MLRNCDLNGIFPYINFFSQFFTRKNFFFQIKNLDFVTVWLIRRPVFLFASLALKTKWMKYMKTRYNALHSVAMMLGLLLVGGVTGAWADLKKSEMGNDVCSPKIHFKLPDGWTNAYLICAGQRHPGLQLHQPDRWSELSGACAGPLQRNGSVRLGEHPVHHVLRCHHRLPLQ